MTSSPTSKDTEPTPSPYPPAPPVPVGRVEPFVVALTFGLGIGALVLALLTRKHLLARQIAPADSPIQVA